MARISSASASGAASPSVTMELDGQSLFVWNTFIHYNDAVDQPSPSRTISAPAALCKPFGAASAASTESVKSSRASSGSVSSEEDDKTTLMFRNLPESFTRARLEDLLDTHGFADCYDFLYLPADMASGACFGYAFVNMVTPEDARNFVRHFQDFEQWSVPSEKRAKVCVNEELQGLDELIGHWRNSSIMHSSVRDAIRPAMYRNGRWSPFPQPTKRLKPPQTKNAARRRANARRA